MINILGNKSKNNTTLKKIAKACAETFSGKPLRNAVSINSITALLLICLFVLIQGCFPKPYKPRLADFPVVAVELITLDPSVTVDIPLVYSDSTTINMFFKANKAAVEAKLDSTPFQLATWSGGYTTVGIGAYEYADAGSDIGAYNEVGLIIPVVLKGEPGYPIDLYLDIALPAESRKISFYVLNIPADDEVAVAAGVEVWGFTKFLSAIDFSLVWNTADVTVYDPESSATILNISGTLGGSGLSLASSSSVTASDLDGVPIKLINYVTYANTTLHLTGLNDMVLTVGESTHPMAQNLRDFGLDGTSPESVTIATNYHSILYFGNPM